MTPILPVRAPAMRTTRGVTPSALMTSTRARPAASRPTAAISDERAPRRPSQRAAVAAEPPWARKTRPGTSEPCSSARSGLSTTSTTRSPTTTTRIRPVDRRVPVGRRDGMTRGYRPHRPTMAHGRRDDRHRPTRHRHDPHALDRWRAAGELRAPGRPDGRGADGVRAVDAVPAPRPDATPTGPTATGSCCRLATPRCCSTRCST